jgi:hypothetical protein
MGANVHRRTPAGVIDEPPPGYRTMIDRRFHPGQGTGIEPYEVFMALPDALSRRLIATSRLMRSASRQIFRRILPRSLTVVAPTA